MPLVSHCWRLFLCIAVMSPDASKRCSSGVGSRRSFTSSDFLRYLHCCSYLAALQMSQRQPLREYIDSPCSVISFMRAPLPVDVGVLSVVFIVISFLLVCVCVGMNRCNHASVVHMLCSVHSSSSYHSDWASLIAIFRKVCSADSLGMKNV